MPSIEESLFAAVALSSARVTPFPQGPFRFFALDVETANNHRVLAIGIGTWVVLLPATLLLRRPPAAPAPALAGAPVGESGGMAMREVLRSPQFWILGLTFFACCAAHSGPIFHMVSYAIVCGVSPMAAVSIYSVEGLAGLGGRILLGVGADRLGVKPVLVAGLLVQAIVIAAYSVVGQLEQFYLLAMIFGAAYGGVMPLYAVLAHDYFGQKNLGAVLGAATMLSSVGMALGPWIGGWIFDTFQNYAWLFIGSSIVGLGAVAIALAFPPLPRRRFQPA